jgi:deoxyribodipyrimidine photolyase-related protein
LKTLRLILGDQLSRSISALSDIEPDNDVLLMVEVHDEATYVRHHKQKLVLVLSAMRHFAQQLRNEGIDVDYVQLDDANNTGSFTGELRRALERHHIDRLVVTEPGEWRVWQMMQEWSALLNITVDIREDDRFLCSRNDFAEWANARKRLRMEYFYREMRRKTGWLMTDDQPEGGKWNYDADNRKKLPPDLNLPAGQGFAPDTITREIMSLVAKKFGGHFGDLDSFSWAVTREHALQAMHYFIDECLPDFGDYQDAMKSGEDFLFHSVLSPYINIGLLNPAEVCQAAISAYQQRSLPLNAVEGFVRQILGWREYIRGIYWLHMPVYASSNFLDAQRSLPAFYWNADTEMNCLREAIEASHHNAYAHHIQRLMVTGNFALLAGIAPAEVEEWYLSVYADAFEWVELPNTHGMALHADGGLLGSKPYAASGAYIDRMSDYCSSCRYNPKIKLGEKACPLNYLYWRFMIINKKQLESNPRMAMPYRTLSRMSRERREQIMQQADSFLAQLDTQQHEQ